MSNEFQTKLQSVAGSSHRRILLLLLICTVMIFNCSNERDPTTLPGAHPESWMDIASEDFHGRFVMEDGTASCEHCHGIDTPGGKVGISCLDCHGPGDDACIDCHGGVDNDTGAPPAGLRGELSDTTLAVGAHTTHLDSSALAAPFSCDVCHIVPLFVLSPSHLDQARPAPQQPLDSIAEIVWHGIADGGGASWDRNSRTCSGTYCHGNFAGGFAANSPVWTGSNQAGCGSCHDVGADPGRLDWEHHAYHMNNAGLYCADCHASVISTFLNIINSALHVNGRVDTLTRDPSVCAECHGSGPEACTRCHGGADNQSGAPPLGLRGETATSQLAVGAHTIHMEGGSLADAFTCSDCHLVPSSLLDPGHIDPDSTAEMTWSALAGAASSWNRNNATCSNVYCHGNFAGGFAANSPVWTGSNQAGCGSCHDVGADPGQLDWEHHAYHVNDAGLDCADCHASVTNTFLNIIGLPLHVNGQADTLTRDPALCAACHGSGPDACTRCHGGVDNQSGAPPLGLRGETATSQLAVGAHTIHMEGGSLADAFACSDCHLVPASFLDPGHIDPDSTAEMTWSSLAGAASSWNRSNATCSNVYCHGNFAGGFAANSPVWTGANQANCGSCHDVGANPQDLGGRHEKHVVEENLDCNECHQTVVNQQLSIVGPQLHVNGLKDVSLLRGGTYQNGSCSGLNGANCHGTESWN